MSYMVLHDHMKLDTKFQENMIYSSEENCDKNYCQHA